MLYRNIDYKNKDFFEIARIIFRLLLSSFRVVLLSGCIFPADFQQNHRCICGHKSHFHGRCNRHRKANLKHLHNSRRTADFRPKDVSNRPNRLQKNRRKKKYSVFSLKESIQQSSLPILARSQRIFSQSYHLKDE